MLRTLEVAVLLVVVSGCAAPPLSREQLTQLVGNPERSAADRTNDDRRHPVDMLSFIGVRPGMHVLDVSAGGGYTTELLARAVGPQGVVYAQTPKPSPRLIDRLKSPALKNVVLVPRKFDDPVPPEAKRLDLVTLVFNYHDFGHFGVDRASLNRAVFAALTPGRMYVVADHAGRPGTGISESGTLHPAEETLVRQEVEAAGFRPAQEARFRS